MSIKKTVAIAAAAGALAAISVPALAFETEFHGTYKFKTFFSNVDNGAGSAIYPSLNHLVYRDINSNGTALNRLRNGSAYTQQYFEQRFRPQFIAKASDDLRLVTQFELDTRFGGNTTGKYAASSDGGVLDADGISLETKSLYLDFNLGKSFNTKVGIMPIKDSIKGILLDADGTGILTTTKAGPATIGLGYFRLGDSMAAVSTFNETTNQVRGKNNVDLFLLETKFAASKDFNLGFAYYLFADYSDPTLNGPAVFTNHTFALTAEAKAGPATVSGFVAAQVGSQRGPGTTHATQSGYAMNLGVKMAAGPGNFRTAFLFTSGDDGRDNTYTAWRSPYSYGKTLTTMTAANVSSYNEGNMMLLVKGGLGGTTTDRYIVYDFGNRDQGLWLYTLGYDANFTPKAYLNTNAGVAWAAKTNFCALDGGTITAVGSGSKPRDQRVGGGLNGTNFMGAEFNMEAGYKVYDNLTAALQGAYVVLGGHFANSAENGHSPDNPWTSRVVLTYAF